MKPEFLKLNYLIAAFVALTNFLSFGQNNPALISYVIDTTCDGYWGMTAVASVVVQDVNNDSTYINIISYDAALYINVYASTPAYVPGSATRIFEIYVDPLFGVPAGINLSDVDIEIVGNTALDPGTTFTTLNALAVTPNPVIDDGGFFSTPICENNVVDLRLYFSPLGGEYTWGGVYDVAYMFDPALYLASGIGHMDYAYTDPLTGCSTILGGTAVVISAPTLSVITNTSTCGNSDGSASATMSGGLGPYDVYWSNGFAETVGTTSAISSLSAGAYYINITDVNGCKEMAPAPISDDDIAIVPVVTNEDCIDQSADGAINLTIMPSTGSVSSIFWSNGESTEDISGLYRGEYSVQIHTTADCHAYQVYQVLSQPELSVTATTADGFCFTASPGMIDLTVTGGNPPYNFVWNTLATTEDVSSLSPGFYTCAVIDSKGCNTSIGKSIFAMDGPFVNLWWITKATCSGTEGHIEIYPGEGPSPIESVTWSNGATTEDLSGVGPGWYTCTVEDEAGCKAIAKWEIPAIPPVQPEICLLTVDTSLIFNEIVWQKDDFPGVAGFRIYREASSYGFYEMVADQDYSEVSSFQDNAASPIDRSWRYMISTYDACGVESFMSYKHKTIQVVANTSDMINYDLSWDDYEGINYATVKLERYDDVNGWQELATLPFGTNTYADAPPVIAGLDYLVSFNLSVPCSSTKASGIDYNSSRSNTSGGLFNPGGSTSKIADEKVGTTLVFPNPVNDQLTVRIDKPEEFSGFELCDINGKIINTYPVSGNISFIDMSGFRNGVYYLRFVSAEKPVVHKIVKK